MQKYAALFALIGSLLLFGSPASAAAPAVILITDQALVTVDSATHTTVDAVLLGAGSSIES